METPLLHTLKKRVCPSDVTVCTVGRGFRDFSEGLWGKEQPSAYMGRPGHLLAHPSGASSHSRGRRSFCPGRFIAEQFVTN